MLPQTRLPNISLHLSTKNIMNHFLPSILLLQHFQIHILLFNFLAPDKAVIIYINAIESCLFMWCMQFVAPWPLCHLQKTHLFHKLQHQHQTPYHPPPDMNIIRSNQCSCWPCHDTFTQAVSVKTLVAASAPPTTSIASAPLTSSPHKNILASFQVLWFNYHHTLIWK